LKQIEITIPENTFALTDAEIKLIHAMSYYFACSDEEHTGMTKQAQKLVRKMEEQFSKIRTEKDFQVWV
jgi:hypothetical protein